MEQTHIALWLKNLVETGFTPNLTDVLKIPLYHVSHLI